MAGSKLYFSCIRLESEKFSSLTSTNLVLAAEMSEISFKICDIY